MLKIYRQDIVVALRAPRFQPGSKSQHPYHGAQHRNSALDRPQKNQNLQISNPTIIFKGSFITKASSQTEKKQGQQSATDTNTSFQEEKIVSETHTEAPKDPQQLSKSRQLLMDLQKEKEGSTQQKIPSIFYKDPSGQQGLDYSFLEDQELELQKQEQTQSKFAREMGVKEADQAEQKLVFKTQAKPKTIMFNIGDFSDAHIKPEKTELQTAQEEMTEEEQVKNFDQIHTEQELDVQRRNAAQKLEEGVNQLQDGTIITTKSGVDLGENGFQSKWTVISGQTADGETLFEDKYWENSDWQGLKELGAEQQGCNAYGDAWRNLWTEKLCYDSVKGGQPVIIRNAEKRAKNLAGNEWEEKWYEYFDEGGKVSKTADKWTKEYDAYNQQDNIWHEKWGEDYDNEWCRKWTDRWAERGDLSGDLHKWGEKWEEDFYQGKGHKYGETWDSHGGNESDYHRKWGENHFGEGWVRKWGESNTGEQWDTTEQTGTYYNPIPHFGFDHAIKHSLELHKIEPRPQDTPKSENEST